MRWTIGLTLILGLAVSSYAAEPNAGILPVGEDGKPVNTDFETDDLRDWKTLSGNAFEGLPIKGG